jgi:hypothetical protein
MRVTILENDYIGKMAATPQSNPNFISVITSYILEHYKPEDKLKFLDFGAGTEFNQTLQLRKLGFDVTPYDLGGDESVLGKAYDIVFVSNVLNVQPTEEVLVQTLQEIFSIKTKTIIMNYSEYRPSWVSKEKAKFNGKSLIEWRPADMLNFIVLVTGKTPKREKIRSSWVWII